MWQIEKWNRGPTVLYSIWFEGRAVGSLEFDSNTQQDEAKKFEAFILTLNNSKEIPPSVITNTKRSV